ncbi:uncharacterized protein [Nicotiana tomentosiformis]|uniref:uncharacterized protein n=1 Tax=Nicotiana tomentosiformis TaxID=4098 RepID=UPI00388C49B8
MNRTLLERARCMISNDWLTNVFWAETISTACYIVNRAPSAPLNFKTPEEMWSGTLANYSDLKKESSSSCNTYKVKSTHNQVEVEIGIPSEPSSSTLKKNRVETPKVESEAEIPEVETPEVEPEEEELFLTQKKYLEKVLERFDMKDTKSFSTPLAAHFKLAVAQSPQSEEEERYLQGTSNTYLEFGRNTNTLVGFVDSDYADDLDKKKSLTGYIFCSGGCAIS